MFRCCEKNKDRKSSLLARKGGVFSMTSLKRIAGKRPESGRTKVL
jgi:hypothetical protein